MISYVRININLTQYLEVEKIGVGAFLPLSGFMNETEFRSVVENMRLPSGDVFTLPVILDIDKDTANQMIIGTPVELIHEGTVVAQLTPNDFYNCDRNAVSQTIFGTEDISHPGVEHFFSLKEIFVGGSIKLLQRVNVGIWHDKLTPADTRSKFAERNWKRVVGFQTRNVPHRAHEYLQRVALESADGLFIQPLIGQRRSGDFTPEAILSGYETLINGFFPKNRVILGTLSTFMRFAGPREAIFHAIIRRNYGCSHFIVGRDHAGVGEWYGQYDAHKLACEFEGQLGIEILCLSGPYFCETCDDVVTEKTCPHSGSEAVKLINGSDMRQILLGGKLPDSKLMRHEVINSLRDIKLFMDE